MVRKIKVLVAFGTRPEAIKLAPVIKELLKYPEMVELVVVVTAQHREMLDQVLKVFEIVPEFDLGIMEVNQTLFQITVKALEGLEGLLEKTNPELVLVQGDTTTSFACALSAFYRRVRVGHVEAGLRTHDKYRPFPEEINRKLTGALADLHFAPTEKAKGNLLLEGVPAEAVYVTGNTVIDTLLDIAKQNYEFADPVLANLPLDEHKLILVEAHRRESWGEPMRQICLGLRRLVEDFEDILVLWAVHPNPRVKDVVYGELGGLARVYLVEPLDYVPFVHLMKRAYLILTDSGGIQEEAPSLGKPVLVLRDRTERPEGIEVGTAQLVGTDAGRIFAVASKLLKEPEGYGRMAHKANPYGDGRASERVVKAIFYYFGIIGERPEQFQYNR